MTTSLLIAGVHADLAARRDSVSLAAFENVLSDSARSMLSLDLADRYLIGQHTDRGRRSTWVNGGLLCTGTPGIDVLEEVATDAAKAMFGAEWVDFRPLSGLHATICTVAAMTDPGDLVYSIAPLDGGHFATRSLLESTARMSEYLDWADGTVDLDRFAGQWAARPGRMVIFDHGIPLTPIPVAQIRAIVGPDALLVYDASHTLGLIAGGSFQTPLADGCDVLQGNTHKSFPGAHKGLIAFADATMGRAASARIGGALVSSQNTGGTLANFVTTLELAEHGRAYARAMVANQVALATALREAGAVVAAGRTHLLLVDSIAGRGGYDLATDLIDAGLHLNARPMGGRIVLRLGVAEVTRRGMGPAEMAALAVAAGQIARGSAGRRTRADVVGLAREFADVHYSFDTVPARLERRPA